MPYVSTWFQAWCPKCKSSNFVDNGDTSDLTQFDVAGVRCWKCKHCWLLATNEPDEDIDEDEPFYEDGVNLVEKKKR